MQVVVDTNILVSSLWSKNGAPAKVISMILNGILTPCYDYRILAEYREVLLRPKFNFSESEVDALLGWFESFGKSVLATPLSVKFQDDDDKKSYEVAKYCHAILITGNLKHFPKDKNVMSVIDFLYEFEKKNSKFK